MRWTTAPGVFLVVMTATTAIGAQVTEESSAKPLFFEALHALRAHDYERARALFEQSLVLGPRGSVLLGLADAEWALGDHVQALKHLRAALERSDLPPGNREPAQRGLARWSAAMGHVVVNTDAGASIQVDGKPIEGLAPLAAPVDVEPGLRVVETRFGELSRRLEVEVKAGAVVQADAFVVPPPPSPPPAVSVRDPNPQSSSLRIEPPGAAVLEKPASGSFWNTRRTAGVGVAGAGAVSLVVGGIFLSVATRDESRATSASSGFGPSGCTGASSSAACSAQDAARSSERTDGTISRVAMGAGIAALAIGAVVTLWPSTAARNVIPAARLGPNGGELGVQGRF